MFVRFAMLLSVIGLSLLGPGLAQAENADPFAFHHVARSLATATDGRLDERPVGKESA